MDNLKLKTHAKINLYLDVLSKRPDGYHDVVTILQSLELADFLSISPSSELEVICPGLDVVAEDNLAYQAASLLKRKTNARQGARVEITKSIPAAAGLGGGSADAAATLVGLNLLWGLGLPSVDLQIIGAEIGADVPFCLQGGTMLVEGKGEKLKSLPPLPEVTVVLAIPSFKVSTKKAYDDLDKAGLAPLGGSEAVVSALNEGDLSKVACGLANIFEVSVSREHPEIVTLKDKAMEAGALGSLMSGSGGAVFALADNTQEATQIASLFKNTGVGVIVTRPFSRGVEVLSE